jgi:hypothetical protein
MKTLQAICLTLLTAVLISCGGAPQAQKQLSLHPQNPHYFLYDAKPMILIGSTEHYGAVMNLDFDYVRYLDELASSRLNVTRTFSGIYVEPEGAFGIIKNTMAPAQGRYICPWPRSQEPGYSNGGNKFDLDKWDEDYFLRLKDFISEAGKRDIIVELDLFSNYYDTIQWKLSPLNVQNNINNVGNIKDHKEILSLIHPEMLEIQEKMVRKIMVELKDFGNLYYEVCNEPYFGDTLALAQWEKHMTGVVVKVENEINGKHLISNNIANHFRRVTEERAGVSIYNFHYARPPKTVPANYGLNKVIGDNETGFDGNEDVRYRSEAWDFILAGGALFNNLDYSFTTDNEDGTFKVQHGVPGGGGRILRNQFRILVEFMDKFDYINSTPVEMEVIKLPENSNFGLQGLSLKEDLFAFYLHRKDTLVTNSEFNLLLRPGSYQLTWVDTKTGMGKVTKLIDIPEGYTKITSPEYKEDIAVRIEKTVK